MEGAGRVDQFGQEPTVLERSSLDDGQARGRALLAGVGEGGCHEVAYRQVAIGGRGHDEGVLARRLRQQPPSGRPLEEHRRGLGRSGQDHRPDISVGHEPPSDVGVGNPEQLDEVGRNTRLEELAVQEGRGPHRFGRRFEDHGVARGEGGQDATGGDGIGEVPRWGHHHDPERMRVGVGSVEQIGAVGVPPGEVDCLGHLGVGLAGCLVGVERHARHGAASLSGHDVRDRVEQRPAIGRRAAGPSRTGGDGSSDSRNRRARARPPARVRVVPRRRRGGWPARPGSG